MILTTRFCVAMVCVAMVCVAMVCVAMASVALVVHAIGFGHEQEIFIGAIGYC